MWDFGDGNTSNTSSTTHTYVQVGSYDAVLTTYGGNCVETKTKTITISTIGLNEIHPFGTRRVFPNPFIDKITVENCEKEEILLSNILGQNFNNVISIHESSKGLEVDTRNLPKGTYILTTQTSRHLIYKK
jgi:PKD repeat protein